MKGPSMRCSALTSFDIDASGGLRRHARVAGPGEAGGSGRHRRRPGQWPPGTPAGYGVGAFGDRFTATPEVGLALEQERREYRLGWRLALADGGRTAFELALEGTRREHTDAATDPEYGLGLRMTARW